MGVECPLHYTMTLPQRHTHTLQMDRTSASSYHPMALHIVVLVGPLVVAPALSAGRRDFHFRWMISHGRTAAARSQSCSCCDWSGTALHCCWVGGHEQSDWTPWVGLDCGSPSCPWMQLGWSLSREPRWGHIKKHCCGEINQSQNT